MAPRFLSLTADLETLNARYLWNSFIILLYEYNVEILPSLCLLVSWRIWKPNSFPPSLPHYTLWYRVYCSLFNCLHEMHFIFLPGCRVLFIVIVSTTPVWICSAVITRAQWLQISITLGGRIGVVLPFQLNSVYFPCFSSIQRSVIISCQYRFWFYFL